MAGVEALICRRTRRANDVCAHRSAGAKAARRTHVQSFPQRSSLGAPHNENPLIIRNIWRRLSWVSWHGGGLRDGPTQFPVQALPRDSVRSGGDRRRLAPCHPRLRWVLPRRNSHGRSNSYSTCCDRGNFLPKETPAVNSFIPS